jgi:hypothetical protein
MTRATDLLIGKRGRLWAVAVSALIGLVAAGLNTGTLGLFPPSLKRSDLTVAAAATHVFVDTAGPSMVHRKNYPVTALMKRAELYGQVLTSRPVVELIAARVGVPPSEIGIGSRTNANVPVAFREPGSEQRANDILQSSLPYRVEVQARTTNPVLDVYARAPSRAMAEQLADASVAALDDYLRTLADQRQLPTELRFALRQLGPARGAVVNDGTALTVGIMTFLVTFAVCGVALALLRRGLRPTAPTAVQDPPAGDNWPHTTRLLPWTLAAFIALLWLVPFNNIELNIPFPIDLKFDRLVLPFVAAASALAILFGGRAAPQLRLTWIHAGVGAFVVVAFASVLVDAHGLNRGLELDRSLKQLPLLIAYVSLFVIASSAVRGSEVRAFFKYTLGLAVICAIGVIWEYRFKQNLFYNWSSALLPGIFDVAEVDASAVDNIGRRMVRGPAALPLETVAMLAAALPIALVPAMQSKTWRERIIYGAAACLLLAAALATYRKSALLAPLSVIATIAYFRRRELLKLAPLGLVVVVVVHVVAPGALGKTTTQFDPSQLGVSTVSDRAADYDAVRPDLWTHFAFGRGWGSYDHMTYRILDSELLHRVLEMGVLGLIAFVYMVLSVVWSARRTINARDPEWAPFALMGAAAAVSFFVASTLFDILAFPHATYIFLYIAGLVAVVVKHGDPGPAPPREPPAEAADRLHGGRTHSPGRRPARQTPGTRA